MSPWRLLATAATTRKKVADHPRVRVLRFESGQDIAHTSRSFATLRAIYPDISFVWIMGADNLAVFHLWKDWRWIMENAPMVIFDRPGYRAAALFSPAAAAYQDCRASGSDLLDFAFRPPPVWAFLTGPLSPISSSFSAAFHGVSRRSGVNLLSFLPAGGRPGAIVYVLHVARRRPSPVFCPRRLATRESGEKERDG